MVSESTARASARDYLVKFAMYQKLLYTSSSFLRPATVSSTNLQPGPNISLISGSIKVVTGIDTKSFGKALKPRLVLIKSAFLIYHEVFPF